MEIKEKIQEFRLSTNLSVNDFAEGLGYSESHQYKLECGAKKATRKYIENFKEKYPHADINYIFFTK